MRDEARAYQSYTAYCASIDVTPLALSDWKALEGAMKPSHEKNDSPSRPRHHSRLLDNPQASYLDLTFPSLHADEVATKYTVVGPK